MHTRAPHIQFCLLCKIDLMNENADASGVLKINMFSVHAKTKQKPEQKLNSEGERNQKLYEYG